MLDKIDCTWYMLKSRVGYFAVKYFIQRGRRGWSDVDAWNLSSYLEEVLANALPELANTHGHPCVYDGPEDLMQFTCRGGDSRCMCSHNWNVMLFRNAELFNRLQRDEFWDFEEEEAVRKEATEWLVKYWTALWD